MVWIKLWLFFVTGFGDNINWVSYEKGLQAAKDRFVLSAKSPLHVRSNSYVQTPSKLGFSIVSKTVYQVIREKKE